MIETALINLVQANATLKGLISGRIRPFTDANTVVLPAITYWRTNSERPICNDGPTGQCIATFQIDSWALDAATGWQVLEAFRLAFNGYSGVESGSGMKIDSIRFQDQADQINTVTLPGKQKSTQRATDTIVISYSDSIS